VTDRDRPADASRSFTIGGIYLRSIGKERKSDYIAPLIYYVYLKAHRHGSHSFACKYTTPACPSSAFTSCADKNVVGLLLFVSAFAHVKRAVLLTAFDEAEA